MAQKFAIVDVTHHPFDDGSLRVVTQLMEFSSSVGLGQGLLVHVITTSEHGQLSTAMEYIPGAIVEEKKT